MIPRFLRKVAVLGSVLTTAVIAAGLAPSSASHPNEGVDALGAIVGVWQSDTVNGASALSSCDWTPSHGGVVCEQTITTAAGQRHALNLYAFDSAGQRYVYYGLSRPGDAMSPVALAISGPIWTYGSASAIANAPSSRTINDFSNHDAYSWRQETTQNGRDWVVVRGGRSTRLK